MALEELPTDSFGHELKSLRKQYGLSQADLAGLLCSTQRHVSFLETGRSRPSRQMIERIERALALPVSRRLSLYEAAGVSSPYKRRDFRSQEIAETLDMIERRVLAHWPFPAFVLSKRWDILRMNQRAGDFLGTSPSPKDNQCINLFELLMDSKFRARIVNWQDAAPALATRLIREAREDAHLLQLLQSATRAGLFDGIDYERTEDIPIFVPISLRAPDGSIVKMTSMIGQLSSVQDAIIEGLTIELMIPVDQQSEETLLATS